MGKHVPIETKKLICKLAAKNWTPHTIRKFLSEDKLKMRTVERIVADFRKTGVVVQRKVGSGKKPTKQALCDQVIKLSCSQEDTPGKHLSSRQISHRVSVSLRTVGILKKYGFKCYKRYVSNHVSFGARERRLVRCRALLDRCSSEDVNNMVFQDEADLTLQVPINR